MWANPFGASWSMHQADYQNVPHEQGNCMFGFYVISFCYEALFPPTPMVIQDIDVYPVL